MNRLRIAVLLTVHNRKEITLACLANLFKQQLSDGIVVDIYLTDDGCTDGTREAVETKYPQVKIVEGDGSLFWNRGMYVAWREAAQSDYDYYLWLNDDTFLFDDVIKKMLKSSAAHGDSSVIVGSTCAVGNKADITYGGIVDGDTVVRVEEEQRCDTFNGNIVLIPRCVFKVLGTNDPTFRHYLGDTDYGLRANEQGIEVWTAKDVLGECDRHDRPAVWKDYSQPLKKRWRNFFSPLGNNPFEFFYFRRKHYGLLPACQTFASNFIHLLFPWLWKKNKRQWG